MKRLVLVALAMAIATLMGCTGKMYVKETPLSNGMTFVQHGRTGAFGTDNSGAGVITPAIEIPAQKAEIVTLEEEYTKNSKSWEGCGDEEPNRNAKNIKREKSKETWKRQVLIREAKSAETHGPEFIPMGFGSNGSTGNLAVPAAIVAAGYVGGQAAHRPDRTNIRQSGGGASATGGNANAEAASASSSASNAEAWQNQDQSLKNATDVDVDIERGGCR